MADNRIVRALFMPKYTKAGPSSRYRFYNYLELFEKSELRLKCTVKPLFNDKFVNQLFFERRKNKFLAAKCYFKRIINLLTIFRYSLVVIEYELFPYFPPIFERLMRVAGIKYIVDYDDAIFSKYENGGRLVRFFLGRKIQTVIKLSEATITGNNYLLNYARRFNRNAYLIPTVVSADRYDAVRPADTSNDFVIGWIGSPETASYLIPFLKAFRQVRRNKIILRLIGFDMKLMHLLSGLEVECVDWDEETEIAEIKRFNVGIMPLPDDPWSRGKCGFKLIQYMACRLPVIASPVGANSDIVEDGITGLLAMENQEWIDSIHYLCENREKAVQMGLNGYEKFRRQYSLESVSDKYVELLLKAAE
jgi:glycosyltransferase involved in cell wall biosynthesis